MYQVKMYTFWDLVSIEVCCLYIGHCTQVSLYFLPPCMRMRSKGLSNHLWYLSVCPYVTPKKFEIDAKFYKIMRTYDFV